MHIEQTRWTLQSGWMPHAPGALPEAALVFVFGCRECLMRQALLQRVHAAYPGAHIAGCSTAGEICDVQVLDESLVVTAIAFEKSHAVTVTETLCDAEDSFVVGSRLASALPKDNLAHAFVLSDGSSVNGSALVEGLTLGLPPHVTVTGGLAGDADRFQETVVYHDGQAQAHCVSLIGLYGSALRVGFGSLGGWDPFGPDRLVTRAHGNVLYELDGRSALALYKTYLGEHAHGLPATALLFPLSLRTTEHPDGLVRTILAVNEAEQSMTFAGEIPLGATARLMKANFDRLIDGAQGAARTSYEATGSVSPDLAILISCVGRKLILKQRVEEEVEAVRDVLGVHTTLAGFYSYGEISPFSPGAHCELHNQTMTITTLREVL